MYTNKILPRKPIKHRNHSYYTHSEFGFQNVNSDSQVQLKYAQMLENINSGRYKKDKEYNKRAGSGLNKGTIGKNRYSQSIESSANTRNQINSLNILQNELAKS